MMGKIILVSAIFFACGGCTVLNTYRFRVEDATDGRPIAGVDAEGNNDRYEPGNNGWPMHIYTQHHFAVSNPEGLVRFSSGSQKAVTFTRDGYEPCTVVASSPGYKEKKKMFGGRTFDWEDDQTALILLQPVGSKEKKSKEEQPKEEKLKEDKAGEDVAANNAKED